MSLIKELKEFINASITLTPLRKFLKYRRVNKIGD
jgi:hypothetical protein